MCCTAVFCSCGQVPRCGHYQYALLTTRHMKHPQRAAENILAIVSKGHGDWQLPDNVAGVQDLLDSIAEKESRMPHT
jgi:hypothetical protein